MGIKFRELFVRLTEIFRMSKEIAESLRICVGRLQKILGGAYTQVVFCQGFFSVPGFFIGMNLAKLKFQATRYSLKRIGRTESRRFELPQGAKELTRPT